ncbi:MAG: hypothetical protein ABR499_03725 [Gemmatimonadaceae bacterium]
MANREDESPSSPDRRTHPNRRNAELRDDLARVLAEWEAVSREEPWHVHPERYGIDSLHEVVRAVLDVALGDGGDEEASERLVRAAAAHGDQRRVQAVGDDCLLREYHALRAALWRYLRRVRMPAGEALTAILRVDAVITVATTAALRGYHRSDMPATPEWAAELLRHIATGSREIVDMFGRKGRGPNTTGGRSRP